VSVILPTFARGHGPLQRSIESVLTQSFGDYELIVVDDGSRDGTEDVLAEYQKHDKRIIVMRFERNSGLPALRVDQAILHSRGDFIAYQFDDDEWTEDSLAVRMEVAGRLGDKAVVYGNADVDILVPDGENRKRSFGGAFNYGLLSNANYIANNAVLHHRAVIERVGLYDPHVVPRRYSDYDLWLRIGREFPFHWIDATVARVNANQSNSLGSTVPLNFSRFRKYIELDRNAALRPDRIGDYDVCGVAALRGYSDLEVDQLRREEIIPFIARHTDCCSVAELRALTHTRRSHRRILVAKPDYSTSVDVTIRNFSAVPGSPFSYSFVQERNLPDTDFDAYDTIVLYRTVARTSTHILAEGKSGKTFVYLMDDNMLRFHEVGPEHAFLAPGTPAFGEIAAQITDSHACIGYSDEIIEDMREMNPHVIRLNTNMPEKFLVKVPSQHKGKLRVAILTGPVRMEIVRRVVWPALKALFARHPNKIELHVWGLDPEKLEHFDDDIQWQPFTHSYDLYRNRLREVDFDVVLVPLEGATRAERSKSPVKLLEAVVSGAVCMCSDVPPYASLPDDVCIKVPNDTSSWQAALERVLKLGSKGRCEILERARSLALSQYSTEVQDDDFLAAFDAADLHRRLGRRKILYVFHEALFGGATLHLLHHAALTRSLGFDVIGLIRDGPGLDIFRRRWRDVSRDSELLVGDWSAGFTEEDGNYYQRPATPADEDRSRQLKSLLAGRDVGLVHAATWMPVFCCLARSLDVPNVLSLHQFYPTKGSLEGSASAIHCSSIAHGAQWAKATGAPTRRIVCPVDHEFFDSFFNNHSRQWGPDSPRSILLSGTLQPRKNQLAAIQAMSLLSTFEDVSMNVVGYSHLAPDYAQQCRAAITEHGLHDRVWIRGFSATPEQFYRNSDILLVASTDESMPQSMLQAMAAGLIVVATDVGGVKELVSHRYTGFIAAGCDPNSIAAALTEALSMSVTRRADVMARARAAVSVLARPSYVRSEVIDLYNQAFERQAEKRSRSADVTVAVTGPQATLAPATKHQPLQSHPVPAQAPAVASAIAAVCAAPLAKPLVTKPDVDMLQWVLALAERRAATRVSISTPKEISLRELALRCDQWSAYETAAGARRIALYLTNSGPRCSVKFSIATAKRPDLLLRAFEFVLPEGASPQQVIIEFEPVISHRPQAFRLELTAQHPVGIYLEQRRYTLLESEIEMKRS